MCVHGYSPLDVRDPLKLIRKGKGNNWRGKVGGDYQLGYCNSLILIKTEKVQTCSRLRLNTSKLVFAVKMTLAVGTV